RPTGSRASQRSGAADLSLLAKRSEPAVPAHGRCQDRTAGIERGVGFRGVGPCWSSGEVEVTPSANPGVHHNGSAGRRGRRGGARLVGSKEGVTEAPFIAVPLTSYTGGEDSPSLSPDGTQVVFAWDEGKQGNSHIYVKQIGVEPPFRLTNDPAKDFSPAWSPD